jgi:hypothetical protein
MQALEFVLKYKVHLEHEQKSVLELSSLLSYLFTRN